MDGEKKPLWKTKEGREFGFNFNKYRWNRGHWKVGFKSLTLDLIYQNLIIDFQIEKFLKEEEDGNMKAFEYSARGQFPNEEKHYTTDFLFDRAIDYIEERRKVGKKFLAFLSIPDP